MYFIPSTLPFEGIWTLVIKDNKIQFLNIIYPRLICFDDPIFRFTHLLFYHRVYFRPQSNLLLARHVFTFIFPWFMIFSSLYWPIGSLFWIECNKKVFINFENQVISKEEQMHCNIFDDSFKIQNRPMVIHQYELCCSIRSYSFSGSFVWVSK